MKSKNLSLKHLSLAVVFVIGLIFLSGCDITQKADTTVNEKPIVQDTINTNTEPQVKGETTEEPNEIKQEIEIQTAPVSPPTPVVPTPPPPEPEPTPTPLPEPVSEPKPLPAPVVAPTPELTPETTPAVAPTPPPPPPAPVYTPPPVPEPVSTCCKICRKGKACGDSCISRSYTCHKGPGCACNG